MNRIITVAILLAAFILTGCNQKPQTSRAIRFATFNAAMYRDEHGMLKKDLETGGDEQIKIISRIIQQVRPDVLVLQEIDYDPRGEYLDLLQKNYLGVSIDGSKPINYPHAMAFPSNTGLPTKYDFNNDGSIHSAEDAYGYGEYPGQYAFAILSKYPIDTAAMRSFQKFLWKDMPGAVMPENEDGTPWYNDKEKKAFRLSSKNHVDVPLHVNDQQIHVLIAHPTPPVFDGEEDRNGHRNHDEIRLIADYISGKGKSDYLYDDSGIHGGIDTTQSFVIMGDMNADPEKGETYRNPIQMLLEHPQVNESVASGRLVPSHSDSSGNVKQTTAVFDMRIDYVLPSHDLKAVRSGVFWPKDGEGAQLVKGKKGSDHRLVWVDVKVGNN